jgi:hypothetical protein
MQLNNVEKLFYVGDKMVITYCMIEFLSIFSLESSRRIREYPLQRFASWNYKKFLRRIYGRKFLLIIRLRDPTNCVIFVITEL